MWYYNWRKKVGDSLKNMQVESAPELCSLYAKGLFSFISFFLLDSLYYFFYIAYVYFISSKVLRTYKCFRYCKRYEMVSFPV